MLVFGTVIATKPHQVRVKIPSLDDFESDWYFVPQICTIKDKSSNSIAINTEVACCVTEDLQDGCVIGALYNDEDLCVVEDENVKLIAFEDGTLFKYDKKEHKHVINNVGNLEISFKEGLIEGNKLTLNCEVEILKGLKVSNDIVCQAEIEDKTSSMSEMREVYNSHSHSNGNNGADTGIASPSM